MRFVFAFVFVAFVGSVSTSGVDSVATFGVGILYKFFIGNNLLLKLLRTFSLGVNNDPKLFKKAIFQLFYYFYLN